VQSSACWLSVPVQPSMISLRDATEPQAMGGGGVVVVASGSHRPTDMTQLSPGRQLWTFPPPSAEPTPGVGVVLWGAGCGLVIVVVVVVIVCVADPQPLRASVAVQMTSRRKIKAASRTSAACSSTSSPHH
jgi:hypothetical protein